MIRQIRLYSVANRPLSGGPLPKYPFPSKRVRQRMPVGVVGQDAQCGRVRGRKLPEIEWPEIPPLYRIATIPLN